MKKKVKVQEWGCTENNRIVSYVIANKNIPPELPNNQEWYVFRMSIAMVDKMKFDKKLPGKVINAIDPKLTFVATDRKAAKELLSEMIDNLFDAFEDQNND